MGAFSLATSRLARNPVRVQQWYATMRAGDDFMLALTVYDDDAGTLSNIAGSSSRLALFRDIASAGNRYLAGYEHDYGWAWWTLRRVPEFVCNGALVSGSPGRVNFFIPGATTERFLGRYCLVLKVDNTDGLYTQVEGILQVRPWFGASPVVPGVPVVSVSPGVIG